MGRTSSPKGRWQLGRGAAELPVASGRPASEAKGKRDALPASLARPSGAQAALELAGGGPKVALVFGGKKLPLAGRFSAPECWRKANNWRHSAASASLSPAQPNGRPPLGAGHSRELRAQFRGPAWPTLLAAEMRPPEGRDQSCPCGSRVRPAARPFPFGASSSPPPNGRPFGPTVCPSVCLPVRLSVCAAGVVWCGV